MRGNINARRCAGYLRRIGVPVLAETEEAWATQEHLSRQIRRAHNRELKKSCGHFRSSWGKIIHSGGTTEARACSDCGKYVEYRGAPIGRAVDA